MKSLHRDMNLGPKSNKAPYVYTNPSKDTELYTCDKVFVVSIEPIQQVDKLSIKDWLVDMQVSKKCVRSDTVIQ
jgi:hypothetical protein